MPASYRVDVANLVVWTRFWGRVTIEEMEAYARRLRDDPRFDPSGRQVAMFTDADPTHITSEGVRHIASVTGWAPGARRAMVMSSDVGYGVGRQYALMTERPGEEVRIFRGTAEALAWLGLPPDWQPPPPSPDDPVFEIPRA